MEEKNETFTYTYSSAQQEEVKRIRDKYAPPTQEEDKLERLRKLDKSVTKPGLIAALPAMTAWWWSARRSIYGAGLRRMATQSWARLPR